MTWTKRNKQTALKEGEIETNHTKAQSPFQTVGAPKRVGLFIAALIGIVGIGSSASGLFSPTTNEAALLVDEQASTRRAQQLTGPESLPSSSVDDLIDQHSEQPTSAPGANSQQSTSSKVIINGEVVHQTQQPSADVQMDDSTSNITVDISNKSVTNGDSNTNGSSETYVEVHTENESYSSSSEDADSGWNSRHRRR